MLSITPSVLTFQRTKTGNSEPIQDGLKERHEKNGFTKKSRKTMLERLRNFMFAQKYELTEKGIKERKVAQPYVFLTLTLCAKQKDSDIEIKAICLDNFLNKLRYHLGVFSYIWKAEAQENGNIHFHIIMNKEMGKKKADKLWHDSLELLGYVTLFEKKHGHRNPPTNRIETVFSQRRVMGYATKYVAKVDEYRKIDGMAWGCSKDIQTEVRSCVTMTGEDERKVKVALRKLGIYSIANEYCEKFYLEDTQNVKELPLKLRHLYNETIQYYLGRQICEDGMERRMRFENIIQLSAMERKGKINRMGAEILPIDLFDSSVTYVKIKGKKRIKYNSN